MTKAQNKKAVISFTLNEEYKISYTIGFKFQKTERVVALGVTPTNQNGYRTFIFKRIRPAKGQKETLAISERHINEHTQLIAL